MILLVSFAAGILIGILFYGGLWWTVRTLLSTRHPVLLTVASFWLRTAATLAGFLFAMNGSWQNAFACLAGFGCGRVAVSALLAAAARRPEGAPRCT